MRTSPVPSSVKDSLSSYFVYRAPYWGGEGVKKKKFIRKPPPFSYLLDVFTHSNPFTRLKFKICIMILDFLVKAIYDFPLSHSLYFVYHCLMSFDTQFLNYFHCWLIFWPVDAHCLSLIYSHYIFINKLTLYTVCHKLHLTISLLILWQYLWS